MSRLTDTRSIRISTILLLASLLVVSGCGKGTPSEADARAMYEKICAADPSFQGNLKVLSFKKTDGLASEALGIKEYQLSFEAELEVLREIPAFTIEGDAMKGALLRHKGKIRFAKSEKGWGGQEPGEVGARLRDIGKIDLIKSTAGGKKYVPSLQPDEAVSVILARGEARQRLSNNLKELALSMHSYSFNDAQRRLPSPGFSSDPKMPLLSWRVAILPYINQMDLYKQFKLDESWDSPANKSLLFSMPKVFEAVGPQTYNGGHTYLQFVTGPGTLFPTPTSVVGMPRSFPDGTSNTILIVEASESVPWTKPADFHIDVSNIEQGAVTGLGSLSKHEFTAAFADGSVRVFDRRRVSDRTLRIAFNPTDGNPLGSDF